jgi:hypothetical protein
MAYNLAQPYNRSFKGPIDSSLVFASTTARTNWLATPEGLAIAYSGMIVSDLETNKAYILDSSNQWQELASSQLATSSISGLVKLFDNTTQSEAAQTVSSTVGKTYGIQFNDVKQLVVNVPWTDTVYSHPSYTAFSTITSIGSVISSINSNSLGHITGVGTRSLSNSDVGLSNVTNNSQIIASAGRTVGYVPTWNNTNGTTLDNGYGVTTAISSETATDAILATSNAVKTYVDNTVASNQQGLDTKASVRLASTPSNDLDAANPAGSGNVLIANNFGTLSIDGVTPEQGDRILLKNQSFASQNGIYNVVSLGGVSSYFRLDRSTDANSSEKVTAGLFTFVSEGNTNADTGWVLTSDDDIALNTDDLNFAQFSAAGQIYDGDGLTKSGNIISVGQGDGITVSANAIAVNTTVLRTTGPQTVTGEKDFGNNLKIKPIYNSNGVGWFPAFNVEPSGSSQKMVYMTKADLVTALSFETPELGNSFVNTTGNQSISGIKTFVYQSNFNGGTSITTELIGGRFQPIGAINLFHNIGNLISYNASGTSNPPANGFSTVAGTKLVLCPSNSQLLPPVAIGLGTDKVWNVVPSDTWNYEWYAGPNKIATLYGNGTFNATNISGTNFYLGGSQITASASEINLLASASDKDILIGSGSNFVKQNLMVALSGAIISQSGLSVTKTSSNLIINHNLSTAISTSNPSGYAIDNVYLDNYGHITGVRSINLDERYLTSANLNSQITFTSGINSSYSGSTLTVFHSAGQLSETSYGVSGIKTITLDKYGHISGITTANYVEVENLCSAISGCTIDGGTY